MSEPLAHPLILKASKVCLGKKGCGYTMSMTKMGKITDPESKERIQTTKVVMRHAADDMPLPMHKFLRQEMSPLVPGNRTHWVSPKRDVSIQIKKTDGGHEIHMHSIGYTK
jgi:hypothetical protein